MVCIPICRNRYGTGVIHGNDLTQKKDGNIILKNNMTIHPVVRGRKGKEIAGDKVSSSVRYADIPRTLILMECVIF
ncbi:protein of unknown function [Xenorhabdus poinarii G6]|uniref:Uncharacterized protein n=1 Tax=Xenorhabdus poinarii G6 TaxID=1354304 RepID=A0A068R0P2_9GAMM|nr:protein of unknown function [Xenorhabdus poinarii G6]